VVGPDVDKIGPAAGSDPPDRAAEGPGAAGERCLEETRPAMRLGRARRDHAAQKGQALPVLEQTQLLDRAQGHVRIGADAEGPAVIEERREVEDAIAEIGLGRGAEPDHGAARGDRGELLGQGVGGVDQAPAAIDRGDIEKVTDRAGAILYDPAITVEEVARRAAAMFPQAFEPAERPLPNQPAFAHLFAGLIQFVDWLASDTRYFPLQIDLSRESRAKTYADRAVTALHLDSRRDRTRLRESVPDFQEIFDGFPPRPVQAAMADETLAPLVILESETGSGKTEAALWRFANVFRRGEVDSLYFALPTRVSAMQIYERVRRAIARLWPNDPPLVLRALPGYSAADGEQPVMLPDFKVQWNDNPNDEAAQRRWAAEAPKRFLAAPVAVGTIDQALLGILKVKHAHMRAALLARSLLVVDEVHASDAYMTVLMEQLLKAHLGNGGHALLLSATLGSNARTRYLRLGNHS